MEYEMMVPPFKHTGFENLKKKETHEYFKWYVSQIGHRIKVLEDYILNEGENIIFDYSPESLIPLWTWYEKKIIIVDKMADEFAEDLSKYPEWMHNEISKTKISLETLKFGMDIAIYFAEIIIKECNGKIQWGYFTKPKNRMSVNEPTLLGFEGNNDLNPRLIVINCTRRSSRESKNTRLYDVYNTWMEYI